jgi:hypothetical protein
MASFVANNMKIHTNNMSGNAGAMKVGIVKYARGSRMTRSSGLCGSPLAAVCGILSDFDIESLDSK